MVDEIDHPDVHGATELNVDVLYSVGGEELWGPGPRFRGDVDGRDLAMHVPPGQRNRLEGRRLNYIIVNLRTEGFEHDDHACRAFVVW